MSWYYIKRQKEIDNFQFVQSQKSALNIVNQGENYKMNKNKFVRICYLIPSVCFYFLAITDFFNDDTSQAFIHLCLGSSFLCLSSVWMNKDKEDL